MTDVLPSPCSSAPEAAHACRPVRGAAELAAHLAIRREVFVAEQGLFAGDDRDPRDDDPLTVHALGLVDDRPAGTVRLYPLGAGGLWKGDRLAVLREHRRSGIGAPLVRLAVRTARALGGELMVAQVQAVNTDFFISLGWSRVGEPADLLGRLHQQMTIGLSAGA